MYRIINTSRNVAQSFTTRRKVMSKQTTQRLTTRLREEICENVVTALFKDRLAALAKLNNELATKLLHWHVEPKHLALMKQLPPHFFSTTHEIRYQSKVSGFRAEYGEITTTEGLRVPADIGNYGRIELPSTHGMWKEIRARDAEFISIYDDKKALREKINGLLNGVTTVKALVATWPEVTEYLPEFEEKLDVPAVKADELNVLIAKLKK
jgi:hypothetical protein